MPAPQHLTLDGVNVTLDAYCVRPTFQGSPNVTDVIQCAKREANRVWGGFRPILVVEPALEDGKQAPTRCMMAWLVASEHQDPDDDGTHLIVIWFDDDDPTDPLIMALKHVHEAGGWREHARGWAA
jgi:hypothetical protein